MFLKTLLLALMLSPAVQASSGSANFLLDAGFAGFDYKMTNGVLRGTIYGFAYGQVHLYETDDGWEGTLGNYRVEIDKSRSTITDDGTVRNRFRMKVVPSGIFTITTVLKPNGKFSVSGRHNVGGRNVNLTGYVAKTGKSVGGGHDDASYSIRRKGGGVYKGSTYFNTDRGSESYGTILDAMGTLDPSTLARVAPQLYAIVYVLPYSLHK